MEVVINSCYGGFGLSDLAKKELYHLKCKNIKAMKPEEYFGEAWTKSPKRCQKEMNGGGDSIFGVTVEDGLILLYDDQREKNRSDKKLVKVVKKLGDKASTCLANLKIVEIPDNIEFIIDDYDGVESIHESHREWS